MPIVSTSLACVLSSKVVQLEHHLSKSTLHFVASVVFIDVLFVEAQPRGLLGGMCSPAPGPSVAWGRDLCPREGPLVKEGMCAQW
jgi:hypothetical protein